MPPALGGRHAFPGTPNESENFVATGLLIGVAAAAPAAHAVPARRTASTAGAFPALLPWVLASRDNEGAPFIVIDKRRARLWLYDAQGRMLG